MIARAKWVLLFIAGLPLEGTAQPPQVLQGDQITESALVEALTPTTPILTRRLDPGAASPRKPAAAALLITFQTNATTLTPEARHELDVVGQALNTRKLAEFNFVIEGHADPRGSPQRNQRLSQGRADEVRQYLVLNHGVRADRLRAIGKGDREPLNSVNPAAPENRRVTFVNLFQATQ